MNQELRAEFEQLTKSLEEKEKEFGTKVDELNSKIDESETNIEVCALRKHFQNFIVLMSILKTRILFSTKIFVSLFC